MTVCYFFMKRHVVSLPNSRHASCSWATKHPNTLRARNPSARFNDSSCPLNGHSVCIGVPLLYPGNVWRTGRKPQASSTLLTITDCQKNNTTRASCIHHNHSAAFLYRHISERLVAAHTPCLYGLRSRVADVCMHFCLRCWHRTGVPSTHPNTTTDALLSIE